VAAIAKNAPQNSIQESLHMTTQSPMLAAENRQLVILRFYAEPVTALKLVSKIYRELQKVGASEDATWEYGNQQASAAGEK
jgi:hypothetical protein